MKIKITQTIYCDMDGVLADFNGVDGALERFETESDFFEKLLPFEKNIQAIAKLIADGNEVYILSASPNVAADGSKIRWLKKYLPTLADGHAIIMRCGKNKFDYIKSADGILFDDWSRNLKQWVDGNSKNRAYQIKVDGDIFQAIAALI